MAAFHTTVELESHKRDDSGLFQRWKLIFYFIYFYFFIIFYYIFLQNSKGFAN